MIEFRSVSKRYEEDILAVSDVNLVIAPRAVTVLVGPSGCGKTTLLRMINRMVDPTSGQVFIDDVDVATRNPVQLRRSIGYVMQNSGLMPHRTVLDNVTTVPVLQGVPRKEAQSRGLELLATVGLDASLAKRYPSQLSGGQQQRVGVARGLAADPNILLMDEPFGAVDPIVRRELQTELARIQSELAKTIVFVTHDIDEAFLLGDQVVILREGGHVAQAGTPTELLANPVDDFVADFIGRGNESKHLSITERNGTRLVVDERGRVAGVLSAGGVATGSINGEPEGGAWTG
ncbi:MAG: ATP-binding cassette domain-containing protein [Actinomycetales bacterium]|nr:ATP-binding cassette domain-containing protein [Actinomycetales bacterium]